jgi:hypothetical protein
MKGSEDGGEMETAALKDEDATHRHMMLLARCRFDF